MHFGVQGLDAAIEHLGELCHFRHFGDGQARIGQQFGGAAGGQQLDAQRMQGLGKFNDASFVRDGKQGVHGAVFS